MTKWTGDDAKKVLAEIERIAVLQAEINSAEINAADLSPPDPCKNLLTAARAVVDDFTHDRPILRTSLKALQDAIEQQEQPRDG